MRTRKWLAMATTALALALGSIPAMAVEKRDWYMLNFSTGVCEKGPKAVHADTPDNFHKALRSAGLVDSVRVEKDDDGNVIAVFITYRDTALVWAPSKDACELARVAAILAGQIADNADDLK